MEVPIIGSDSVKWVEVSVPSSSSSSSAAIAASPPFPLAPPTEDYASSSGVKDSPTHLIWKIHKALPHALELLELSANKEFPMMGLRINFPDALSPFAFVCQNQIDYSARHPCLLYALTVSGVAYLLKLRNISTYASSSAFPSDELLEFNIHTYSNHGAITTVAATAGCFAVGFNDGSVCCFQLGILDQSAPDFVHELRDDSGIGRLWGIISRILASDSIRLNIKRVACGALNV
ncbi:hypothetical protein SLA2020_403590 [Shorea laevis]